MAQAEAHTEARQHPIRLYLVVWGWLFVLSACSYLVDYFGLVGYLRWSLILTFMMLKAGLIVAVFMHMAWELSLIHISTGDRRLAARCRALRHLLAFHARGLARAVCRDDALDGRADRDLPGAADLERGCER